MVSLTMFLLSAGNAIVSGLSLAFHHLILIYDSQSSNISIEIHAQISGTSFIFISSTLAVEAHSIGINKGL
ncbi:MAG: hypothetical protein K0R59_1346 [Sphingobacterium sp.]|nr:hypothetical protein [Sphingobacterium sp.]